MNAALMTWCAPRYKDGMSSHGRLCSSMGGHPKYYLSFAGRWVLTGEIDGGRSGLR